MATSIYMTLEASKQAIHSESSFCQLRCVHCKMKSRLKCTTTTGLVLTRGCDSARGSRD